MWIRATRPGSLVLSERTLSGLWVLLQAVISLMEMGFDEKEVIDALRVNNNQQNAAVSTATRPRASDALPSPASRASGSCLRRSVLSEGDERVDGVTV